MGDNSGMLLFFSFFSVWGGAPILFVWAAPFLAGDLTDDYLYKSSAEMSPVIIAGDMSVWDCQFICRKYKKKGRWRTQCANLGDCYPRGDDATDYCDSSTNVHLQIQRVLMYGQLGVTFCIVSAAPFCVSWLVIAIIIWVSRCIGCVRKEPVTTDAFEDKLEVWLSYPTMFGTLLFTGITIVRFIHGAAALASRSGVCETRLLHMGKKRKYWSDAFNFTNSSEIDDGGGWIIEGGGARGGTEVDWESETFDNATNGTWNWATVTLDPDGATQTLAEMGFGFRYLIPFNPVFTFLIASVFCCCLSYFQHWLKHREP
eukprot:Hpha_TRINITY_DN31214_c0_g1::TRINITY_DN31214_c0_g1_i1::g.2480::m.2480